MTTPATAPRASGYARARVFQNAEMRDLQAFFDAYFRQTELRTMLDAGSGYELPLDIPLDVHLVGLDLSEAALAKNENVDEKVIGDVQTYPLPEARYDAALSWWLLEHVPDPRAAVANLGRSLRPGGLLVIGIPYIWSFKGLITKYTPHFVHVWVMRYLLGYPEAGRPGTAPYRTFLRRDLSPRRLERVAAESGLSIVYARRYRGGTEKKLPGPVRLAWNALAGVARALTLGRYDPHASEYIVALRRV